MDTRNGILAFQPCQASPHAVRRLAPDQRLRLRFEIARSADTPRARGLRDGLRDGLRFVRRYPTGGAILKLDRRPDLPPPAPRVRWPAVDDPGRCA